MFRVFAGRRVSQLRGLAGGSEVSIALAPLFSLVNMPKPLNRQQIRIAIHEIQTQLDNLRRAIGTERRKSRNGTCSPCYELAYQQCEYFKEITPRRPDGTDFTYPEIHAALIALQATKGGLPPRLKKVTAKASSFANFVRRYYALRATENQRD
jgi:hypothetical protein